MMITCRQMPWPLLSVAGVVLLVAALWSLDAVALSGGGITAIGSPGLFVDIDPVPTGPFAPSCENTFGTSESKRAVSGSIRLTTTWPAANTTSLEDSVDAYADDTGTFWATATSRSLNHNQERPRVKGTVIWAQRFTKDSASAYVHFTVTNAQLIVDQALAGFNNGGACARINAVVQLLNESTNVSATDWEEDATLAAGANAFIPFNPKGPMTFTLTNVSASMKIVDFDKFNGALNLSGIDVGQQFVVEFLTFAIAGTGFSEFPGEALATYRDPITFGGGVTLEVDGVTPLNNAVSTPIPRDQSHAQAIQPDGKIVSVGSAYNGTNDDFAMARYNADGTLDASFSGDGRLTTDFAAHADAAHAVVLQSDHRIVVAGLAYNGSNNDIAVARYNADGSLDTGFAGGKVQLDLAGADDVAQAVAVQADGKIVVAGYTGNGAERNFVVLRLNTDGTLDTVGFNTTGWVSLDYAGGADVANAIALQSDGKIVLAGTADRGASSTQADFALARFNSDGTLDSTFGTAGKQTSDFGNSPDFAEALAIQASDGKLLVAGHSSAGANADFAFARYNADGSPDPSFGTAGKTTQDFAGGHDYAYALAIQSDGKILAAGYAGATTRDFAILRLMANGAPDTQFGVNGKTQIDFSGGDDLADSMAVQADGKIIVAGWAATANGDDFAMLRLNP
jgi:uncharacterized delta-60 repeat protein